MPVIPAFCDDCGTAFASGIVADNVATLTLRDNRAGPCPRCGGRGHIPDGVFSVFGETLAILSAPERTRSELRQLSELLEKARKRDATPEAVEAELAAKIPALSSLAALLPKDRTERLVYLGLVLTAIQTVAALRPSTPAAPVTINQVIEQTINVVPPAPRPASPKPPPRNLSCPCGSGTKYKKCCAVAPTAC